MKKYKTPFFTYQNIYFVALFSLFLLQTYDVLAAMPIGNANVFTSTQSFLQTVAEGLMSITKWVALVILIINLLYSAATKSPLYGGVRLMIILIIIASATSIIEMTGIM